MPEPITIPLSVHQQARLAALRADEARATERKNDMVTALIAAEHDPNSFVGWRIELQDAAIVCTPPAE